MSQEGPGESGQAVRCPHAAEPALVYHFASRPVKHNFRERSRRHDGIRGKAGGLDGPQRMGAAAFGSGVRYQTVCSRRQDAPEAYCTYGLECLGECRGTWVQMDVIEDVSPSRENVLFLAERFNTLGLSPLHFRDAVLDSLNG